MSIQTQIDRISESVSAALIALREKGVTVPDGTKVDGLAALISAIESGGGGAAISEADQWLIDFWHQRTSFAYAFYRTDIENIPLIDTSKGTDFSYMFYGCSSLTTIPQINVSNGTNFSYMFLDCSSLTTIPQINVSNGANFSYMFRNCSSLTTIPQLNVSNGTNFSYMFYGCSSLTTIPQINVSNGTNFSYMFRNCSSLTTIPQLNVSNGTNFSYMFYGCSSLTTIPQINVSNGTNFRYMFQTCSSLTTISFVEGCIKQDISFSNSGLLSDESIQSIIDGLADLTGGTSCKITFHSGISGKLTDEQKQRIIDKNWTIG